MKMICDDGVVANDNGSDDDSFVDYEEDENDYINDGVDDENSITLTCLFSSFSCVCAVLLLQ